MDANTNAAGSQPVMHTVTAHFDDPEAAKAAIAELRGHGIDASSITMTIQGQGADERAELVVDSAEGISRREIGTSDIYRMSPELPNDEELPTTEAYMTDEGAREREVTVIMDHDIPPDEPMGGGLRLGINKTGYDEVKPADHDMVRRREAPADVDIYTDFPDEPGGLNPDSPMIGSDPSQGASAEGHSPNSGLPPAKGEGATVTVNVDDTERDFVRPILDAHGGREED